MNRIVHVSFFYSITWRCMWCPETAIITLSNYKDLLHFFEQISSSSHTTASMNFTIVIEPSSPPTTMTTVISLSELDSWTLFPTMSGAIVAPVTVASFKMGISNTATESPFSFLLVPDILVRSSSLILLPTASKMTNRPSEVPDAGRDVLVTLRFVLDEARILRNIPVSSSSNTRPPLHVTKIRRFRAFPSLATTAADNLADNPDLLGWRPRERRTSKVVCEKEVVSFVPCFMLEGCVGGRQQRIRPSYVPTIAVRDERNTAVVSTACAEAREITVRSVRRQSLAFPSQLAVNNKPSFNGWKATLVAMSGCCNTRRQAELFGCHRRTDRSVEAEARKCVGEKHRCKTSLVCPRNVRRGVGRSGVTGDVVAVKRKIGPCWMAAAR